MGNTKEQVVDPQILTILISDNSLPFLIVNKIPQTIRKNKCCKEGKKLDVITYFKSHCEQSG